MRFFADSCMVVVVAVDMRGMVNRDVERVTDKDLTQMYHKAMVEDLE